MSKKTKDNQKSDIQKRNFDFFLGSRQRYIRINCDFDSGNIDCIRQLSQFSVNFRFYLLKYKQYRLESVHDGSCTNNKVNSKSWFYFSVEGFPKNTKGRFSVNKVQTLTSVFYSKYNKAYRPVYKIEGQDQWHRLSTEANLIMRQTGQLQCVFQYLFKSESEKVYFAFCYPYSYKEHIVYMNELNEFLYIDDFYFYKEILVKSPQSRNVHLLTITSYDHKDKQNEKELVFDQHLFPQKTRPLRFNKPVVLISARVHPGQTPASYAIQGVIQFLTNKHDLRANLLRKMFVFMIIPMINVDGVYHGHFRMDNYGKNLNRFYLNPDPNRQPAIYAIKQLANHLTKENRLSFYFDLHAHNAKKGCFIYGNAINDFVEQVESQVFCKLFSLNHKGFEYNYCNFSEKHMNAKDQNEDMTKQGCGRVVMYRLANIIHSYSLECGIISPNKVNMLSDPINTDFQINEKRFIQDPYENNKNPIYNDEALFTEGMYKNLGKNLLVSILDVFDKNPYNRIYNSHYKSMDMLRRVTAFEIFHNTERFRMFQRFVYGKVKNINELIKEVLNEKLHYKKLYNFYFFDDKQLKHIKWPENIPGLSKAAPKSTSPYKLRKLRSMHQPKKQYEYEFLEILQKNKLINEQQGANIVTSRALISREKNDLENQYSISSKSSETQDYTPVKNNNEFNEQQFLDQQMHQKQQQKYLSTSQRNFSNMLIGLKNKEIQFSSLKLQEVQSSDHQGRSPEKNQRNQSPSVRVRRLLKQENLVLFSTKQVKQSKQIKRSTAENRISQGSIFSKDSLIQSIKEDIKLELKKKQERKLSQIRSKQNYLSHMGYFGERVNQKDKGRIRSTSIRNQQTKVSGSKIQLPALGTHFFIISSSNRAINKKL